MKKGNVSYWVTDEIKTNPCAEQTLGGFLVPDEFKDEILNFMQEGRTGMKLFEYDEGYYVNLNQIQTFYYDLFDISPELSDGDIFEIMVFINLTSGEDVVISDLKYVSRFVQELFGRENSPYSSTKKDLVYYVRKAGDYKTTVAENKETK
jgi:hypothetical protein